MSKKILEVVNNSAKTITLRGITLAPRSTSLVEVSDKRFVNEARAIYKDILVISEPQAKAEVKEEPDTSDTPTLESLNLTERTLTALEKVELTTAEQILALDAEKLETLTLTKTAKQELVKKLNLTANNE